MKNWVLFDRGLGKSGTTSATVVEYTIWTLGLMSDEIGPSQFQHWLVDM